METRPPDTSPQTTARPGAAVDGTNGHRAAAGDAPPRAFMDVGVRLAELKDYAGYFASAKLDAFKLTVRNVALYAVLGLVAVIAGVGLLVTAAALLLTGLAGAVGAMFSPDRPWAGALIVGFVVLIGAVTGVLLLKRRLTGASRRRTVEKYEKLKQDERARYGHDVQECAREHAQQQSR